MPPQTHRARWIAPVDAPPIENGRLVIDAGRIVAVERVHTPSAADVDHGDALITPGFVNAHTHLELTPYCGRVPYRGSFVRWVEDLVAARLADVPDADPAAAIRQGVRQSLATGVTAIGDIGCGPHAITPWSEAAPAITGYLEVLGMGPRRDTLHLRSFDLLRTACDDAPADPRCRVGLSPHAPYSVDTSIYQQIVAWAARSRRPLCTHLAETPDEARFLADGSGPFRDLLERWGLWDGTFTPPGCSPVQYMYRLGFLEPRPLLVHVNYAADDDLDLLARTRAHVAFCPRSHAFFDHEPHRWPDMLDRRINVCIGTDSLASNDSLSLLDELRFLSRRASAAPPDLLLRMATLAGARALGLDRVAGSLTPGKSADFVVLPLSNPATPDPLQDVLSSPPAPPAVYLSGQPVERP